MQFLLDNIPVQDPRVLLETCQENDLSTSLWLGKANCYVDRRGADPSYGYFLVDYSIIQKVETLTGAETPGSGGGTGVTPTGAYKLTLKILYDEPWPVGTPNPLGKTYYEKEIPDLYLESYVNVTPSLSGVQSTYLLKLVDGRYCFSSQETSRNGRYFGWGSPNTGWMNKVEGYLTPEETKEEYSLDAKPEFSTWIYDEYTVRQDALESIGNSEDGVDIKVPKPRTWEEVLYDFIEIFCGTTPLGEEEGKVVFPYFAGHNDYEYKLIISNEVKAALPKYIPQDLTWRYTEGRDFLYKLLYWTNTSLIYKGKGKFELISVENKEKNKPQGGGKWTELEEELFKYGNPTNIQFDSIGNNTHTIPAALGHQYRTFHTERGNNEIDDWTYSVYQIDSTDSTTPLGRKIEKQGRNVFELVIPMTFVSDRLPISPDSAILPEAELINNSTEGMWYWFKYQTQRLFGQYPAPIRTYHGYKNILPSSYIERVSIYDLGDGPYTKVEPILDIEWNLFAPTPIIPREQKFGVILAKCKEEVDQTQTTFEFYDPKVLVGSYPQSFDAYNTRRQNYLKDEEIILVHGYSELWRAKSRVIADVDTDFWFTIDADPKLTLKLRISDLEEEGTGSNRYRYPLEQVEVVNGELPKPNEELEEGEISYISILNQPLCKWDDGDEFIYAAYDETVGDKPHNRWTFGDAYNDIYFLKGLPGYSLNPDIESTDRPLVLKSPGAGSQIGWEQEAADGRTDEELEQFIITIINENGGGSGGGGGSTFIMKALVNKAGGVKSTDATFNYDGATPLVSDGSVLPDSGSCDNTFNCPFVDNEPILIFRKNNGVWTAKKCQENIIRAEPSATVQRNSTTFSLQSISVVKGTLPDNPVAKGDGQSYMIGEPLLLELGNDGNWQVIRRLDLTGLFKVVSTISGASYNSTSNILTIGSGTGRRLLENPSIENQYTLDGTNVVIKNMVSSPVPVNKTIQAKKIGKFWYVDVENCS